MKYSLVWGGAWTVGGISGILVIQAGPPVCWGGGGWTHASLLLWVIHTLGEVLVFHHNFRHPHLHKGRCTRIHPAHKYTSSILSTTRPPLPLQPPPPLSLSLSASSLLPLPIIPIALFPQVAPPFYFQSTFSPSLHPPPSPSAPSPFWYLTPATSTLTNEYLSI